MAGRPSLFLHSIFFSNVSVQDKGTYTLSCQNEIGEGSVTFVLDVITHNGIIQWNPQMQIHLRHKESVRCPNFRICITMK